MVTGKNIGDLLNAKHVTWGWFQGGFAPTGTNSAGYAVCGSEHANIGGTEVTDYVPHHNPFEYYKSTANPKHLPPSSEAWIGRTDQANHQYDLSDFYETLQDGNMPAVSYLKAAEYQDAHPGYSDPIDEQHFVVNTVNQIEESRYWKSTAIVITYDDSDGWYDHQNSPRVNGSNTSADAAVCATAAISARRHPGPVRLRPAAAADRDLPVDPGQLRQPQRDRPVLGGQVHRGQLAPRASGSATARSTTIAGSLDAPGGVLDFHTYPHFEPLILNPATGAVVSGGGWQARKS